MLLILRRAVFGLEHALDEGLRLMSASKDCVSTSSISVRNFVEAEWDENSAKLAFMVWASCEPRNEVIIDTLSKYQTEQYL